MRYLRVLIPLCFVLGLVLGVGSSMVAQAASPSQAEIPAIDDVLSLPGLDLLPDVDVPATECEDACKQRVHQAIRQCVADGGTKERCEARGRELYRDCLTKCQRPKPEPKPCDEACKDRGHVYLRRCLATGAAKERCEARARQVVNECLVKCERPKPEPKPCPEACKNRAQMTIRQCLADGGSQERCDAKGRKLYRECLTKCDRLDPQPPERPKPEL